MRLSLCTHSQTIGTDLTPSSQRGQGVGGGGGGGAERREGLLGGVGGGEGLKGGGGGGGVAYECRSV